MFSLSKGVLVNSFLELEPDAFKALEEGEWCKPDIYSVGPLIRSGSENQTGDGFECWISNRSGRFCLFHLGVVGHFLKSSFMNWHLGWNKVVKNFFGI